MSASSVKSKRKDVIDIWHNLADFPYQILVLLNNIFRIPCHKISKYCIPFIMTIPSTCIAPLFLQNRELQSSNKTYPTPRSTGHQLLILEGEGGTFVLFFWLFFEGRGRLYTKARFDANLLLPGVFLPEITFNYRPQ